MTSILWLRIGYFSAMRCLVQSGITWLFQKKGAPTRSSQPCPPAAPLSEFDQGYDRGYADGKRFLDSEVFRLETKLAGEKEAHAVMEADMQRQHEGAVHMLQQALGECYYRLEKVGAQIVGDLTELRGLAFHHDPAQLLWNAGYEKRRPLTPPDERAEKRMRLHWEAIDKMAEGFAEATAQLKTLSERIIENDSD